MTINFNFNTDTVSVTSATFTFVNSTSYGLAQTGNSATQSNVSLAASSGDTNTSIVLTPKGTGALIAGPVPDGTATGGNARGSYAVDLQTTRSAANRVASGANSVAIGSNSSAFTTGSVAIGNNARAYADNGIAIGTNAYTHDYFGNGVAMAIGFNASAGSGGSTATTSFNTALGPYAATNSNFRDFGIGSTALGYYANTNFKTASVVFGSGRFSTSGDSQSGTTMLRGITAFSSSATTATSGTGTTATITFAALGRAPLVGSTVTVSGVIPAGYNGTYVITASSTTSVSYANATTGAQTIAGTIAFTCRLTGDLAVPNYANIANLPQNSETVGNTLSASAFFIRIDVVGREAAASNVAGAWTITALVSQAATSSTFVIIGTPVVTTQALAASWSAMTAPTLAADTTYGGLNLLTYPVNNNTARWVANVMSTEVW